MEESGSISVQSEQKGATEFSPACPKGLSRMGRRKERQIMNKRRKKKLFRKKTGTNHPNWLNYKAPVFHSLTGWAWTGFGRFVEQCEEGKRIRNLETFNRCMAKRRKNERRKKNCW